MEIIVRYYTKDYKVKVRYNILIYIETCAKLCYLYCAKNVVDLCTIYIN